MKITETLRSFYRRRLPLLIIQSILLCGLLFSCVAVHRYIIEDNGSETQIVSFRSMSVDGVLACAHASALRPEDTVTPNIATIIPSGRITIVRARPVTLVINNITETVYSTADTVTKLLSDNGVNLSADDKVNPDPADAVPYGDKIVVQRTTYAYTSKTETVAYKRVYEKNPFMEVGRSYISVMGQTGILQKTIKVTKVAQQAVSSTVVKTTTIKPVVHEVYDVGTARLDLKPTKTYTMSATAYSNRASTILDGRDHLYGYSGLWLHYGTCAVDRRLIPMGTVLYVQGYGYAVAADTGSSIHGNCIDLFFDSYGDACDWGRRSVKVYVLPITRTQLYAKLGID